MTCFQLIPFASEVPYSNAELVSQGQVVKQAPAPWPGSVTAADAQPLLIHRVACQACRSGSLLPQTPTVRAAGAFPRPASMLMTSATHCPTVAPSAAQTA